MKTRSQTRRRIAISWALEAMKTVLGYEDIRNNILNYYFPQINNIEDMRTFDAFQQYETRPYIDKALEITEYCEDIIHDDAITDIMVMTAANIQIAANDHLTHYQSYIIDKSRKKVYAIDPAAKKNGVGIYDAAVTETVVFPIFRSYDYDCQYVRLSNPAQTNKGDVFCQTWTLVILLKALEKLYKNNQKYIGVIDIPAPRPKVNKYRILMEFFKDILENVPAVGRELAIEYLESVNMNKKYISEYGCFEKIAEVDVKGVFNFMSAEDMMD